MRPRGFTLIELLVAISVMALLALMSWQGLEGMVRAQSLHKARADAVLTLQTALAQWSADLDASVSLPRTRSLDWDGRVLRATRRSTDSARPAVYVVAWTIRADADTGLRWRRWQSPGVETVEQWQLAWDQAGAWAQDGSTLPGASDLALMPVEGWQLLYFRNNAWTPAATAPAIAPGVSATPPDGIRLVLALPPGPALSGAIQRDWVRPAATVSKP